MIKVATSATLCRSVSPGVLRTPALCIRAQARANKALLVACPPLYTLHVMSSSVIQACSGASSTVALEIMALTRATHASLMAMSLLEQRRPCWTFALFQKNATRANVSADCNALTDAFRRGTQWKPCSRDQLGELVLEPPMEFELRVRERPHEPDMQISEVPPDAVVTRLPKLRYHERVGVAERPAAWFHRKEAPVAGGVHHTARPPAPGQTTLREACATPPPPPEHRVLRVCVFCCCVWVML